MRSRQGRVAFFIAVLLLSVQDAQAITVGQPLAAALEELRAAGLRVIFSSALIEPSFTVKADPGTGAPEEVAARILAPYGLALDVVRPGLFAVVRREGAAAAASPAPGPQPGPVQKPVGPVESLPEISVYASRYQIDGREPKRLTQFTREDLDVLPGLNEDVLRVTRYLPGTASNPLSARSHVRGGRDDELAVFFDGAPLFEPFHFKDVQSLFGILDPQSISTVDFYSGVFPTRYGNRLSGVLDIQPRQWDGENHHALGASLLYSQALTQGRLESRPIEWLVSARRGNMDLIARALGRDEAEPDFVDGLARAKIGLGQHASIALGWLSLDDALEIDLGDERAIIDYRDATGWLTWQLEGADHELRATLSRTERHTGRRGSTSQVGSAVGSVNDKRRFDTTTARVEGTASLIKGLRLTGGLEAYDYDAHYDYASAVALDPLLAQAFGRPHSISRAEDLSVDGEAYAAYGSALVDITDRVKLDLGLRWDAQRFGSMASADQVSPRLSLQFQRDPATVMRLSWGRLTQTRRPDELAVQDGDTAFHPAQSAQQIVASVERRTSRNLLWRIEAFEKHVDDPTPSYENLLDPFALLPELGADRVRIQPDSSRTQGAELSLRWELPPDWLGWMSYSWSQARDRLAGRSVPRSWDQKHSLGVGFNWSRGRWSVAGNALGHSGWQSNVLRLTPGAGVELQPLNSTPWPDYFSVDLRGTWARPMRAGSLHVFAEVLNATNRNNPCCSDYRAAESPAGAALSREVSGWLPRLYQLGVNWEFP